MLWVHSSFRGSFCDGSLSRRDRARRLAWRPDLVNGQEWGGIHSCVKR